MSQVYIIIELGPDTIQSFLVCLLYPQSFESCLSFETISKKKSTENTLVSVSWRNGRLLPLKPWSCFVGHRKTATSPMAGKNMSCLTFCEKRCVYYICGLQAFKYFSSVAGATHSEWCLNLSTPMLTHRTLQENRFDVHWRSLFSQHSRYFGTFPCSPSTIEILNTEMSECNI